VSEAADIIVVGLGAMGSAALMALARRGVRAVGIDRFRPPHDRGSTHGETRLSRMAVGEGGEYAPLVRRTHELWKSMGAELGETLFIETGGLIIGPREGGPNLHGKPDFVRRSRDVAAEHGVAHEMLKAAEIMRRFPQFVVSDDTWALYEPSGGMAFPERCVAAQLRLAEAAGARVLTGERVLEVREVAGGVVVRTDQRELHASGAVLAAGAWIAELAGAMAPLARVQRQTMHWFQVADAAAYAPGRFPVFIWTHGPNEADYLYGFPVVPGGAGVKLGTEQYVETTTPDTVTREVADVETEALFRHHIEGRLRGVRNEVLRAVTCLYTTTPDHGFIVDRLAQMPRVLVASPCSGHGFKHSAGLGELIAERAIDGGDAGPFGFARFVA
jgi:sarcosine oxidase